MGTNEATWAQYSNSSPAATASGMSVRVGTQAGEQGQLVAAHEDVDGVDLDHPDVVHHATQWPGDPSRRPRAGEPLGGETSRRRVA